MRGEYDAIILATSTLQRIESRCTHTRRADIDAAASVVAKVHWQSNAVRADGIDYWHRSR